MCHFAVQPWHKFWTKPSPGLPCTECYWQQGRVAAAMAQGVTLPAASNWNCTATESRLMWFLHVLVTQGDCLVTTNSKSIGAGQWYDCILWRAASFKGGKSL